MFTFCRVKVCFVKHDGQRLETVGKEGDNLLDVVVNNNLDIDGFGEWIKKYASVFWSWYFDVVSVLIFWCFGVSTSVLIKI